MGLLSKSGGMGLHFYIAQVDILGCYGMVSLWYDKIWIYVYIMNGLSYRRLSLCLINVYVYIVTYDYGL